MKDGYIYLGYDASIIGIFRQPNFSKDVSWSTIRSMGMLTYEQRIELANRATIEGKFADAEALWAAVVHQCEQSGRFEPVLVSSLAKLAEVQTLQRKLPDAERTYKYCLSIVEFQYGPQHPELVSLLSRLASCYYSQAKFAEAEPLCIRLLDLCKQVLGEDHDQVGVVLTSLATLYHGQCQYDKAESCYRRALSIRSKHLDPANPEVLSLLDKYANVLSMTHRQEEAEHFRTCAKKFQSGEWTTMPALPVD
jgi:tetratricopeptide (TPR) repeat protein